MLPAIAQASPLFGLDMLRPSWRLAFAVVFVLMNLLRARYARLSGENRVIDHRYTLFERVLLWLMIVGMFFVPMIAMLTTFFDRWTYQTPIWAGIGGLVAAAGALYLFYRSHKDLGRNWSPTLQIRLGHKLVEHGIYRSIRHPMYAAIWLWGIAQFALMGNWIAGPATLATFLPLYLLRVPHEERMLEDNFGQPYRDYMGRTGRLIPKIGGRKVVGSNAS